MRRGDLDQLVEQQRRAQTSAASVMDIAIEAARAACDCGRRDAAAKVRAALADLAAIERAAAAQADALQGLADAVAGDDGSLVEQYRAAVEESSQEVLREAREHPKLSEIDRVLWDADHPGEPMPDVEDVDGEVQMRAVRPVLCPITRQLFECPVKNKNCGHTYSKAAILDYLSRKRGDQANCPVAGCQAKVSKQTLERDNEMEREVRRRQAASQATQQ
eukprot:m51a1_g2476 hypothetical protein (219) ;mRNA; f:59341-60184